MKLSDFKGEEALDVLAEIIEPLTIILADKDIQELSKQKNTPALKYVKPMLKNHKKEVIEVLAILDRKTVEEYTASMSLITLPLQVMELINDPEVQNLFSSQEQTLATTFASSSPATENTEASEN